MRRHDREVTDFQEILEIIHRCQVCRLALNNGAYPYLLPVNFGEEVVGGQLVLYFHGAVSGTKYRLMEADPHASFEMDCKTVLCSDRSIGECTMAYESVIGQGLLQEITQKEKKLHALDVLTAHYHPEGFAYDRSILPQTRVWSLTVETITAKRRPTLSR